MNDATGPTSGPPDSLAERVILVVDDDEALRSLTANYLRRAGAVVHQAENGVAAFDVAKTLSESRLDCVLCDFRMDGGDGIELYERITTELPAAAGKFVFASGDIEADEIQAFLARTGARVLAKPYKLPELRRMLRETPS